MKLILPRLRSAASIRTSVSLCVATAMLLVSAPTASAALITSTQGSATTTITSIVFNADSTISIEADQSGTLSHVGAFTAHFSYLAIPTPVTISIVGTGTLTASNGDKINLTATVLELGADYPRTLNGVLVITGGTGRYAGATGTLLTSGTDEESLTDTIQIQGTIVTVGSLLGGLLK
jgi:hypothetical protein